ncbi:MAG: hypothetical protein DWQ42_01370, partial [Planctomycetota bacterium]
AGHGESASDRDGSRASSARDNHPAYRNHRVVPGDGPESPSPRLDVRGNSVRGLQFFEELSQTFDLHVSAANPSPDSLLRQFNPL